MGRFILQGNLRGAVCADCSEPLSGVRARFYRPHPGQNPFDPEVALDADQIHSKHSRLLGECATDAAGDFTVYLDGELGAPETVELDIYFDTVPHRAVAQPSPAAAQFSIAAMKPEWQDQGGDSVAAWDYCLPAPFWSSVRERFDAWVIRGRVKSVLPGQSTEGLKVWAFDRDWLEDDVLGPGVTDAEGWFRIDYSSAQFSEIMEIGGPDVYFRVETGERVVLLEESPSQGRTPGRENIGPCFCIELEINTTPAEEAEPIIGPM